MGQLASKKPCWGGGGADLEAEPVRCRGGAKSCGAAGPVPPRTSPSPLATPIRAGFACRLASAGKRRSLLVRGAVVSAGGARTQVPARAKRAALTGRAGPGPGPGRTVGPARPPGPAADQVGARRRLGLEDAGGSRSRVRGPIRPRAGQPSCGRGDLSVRLEGNGWSGGRGTQQAPL